MGAVGKGNLNIQDFYQVVFGKQKVEFAQEELKNIHDSYNFLEEFSKGKIIYGINTGLGPMAQHKINEDYQKQLQLNLIRSHSAGIGDPLCVRNARAAMLARLNSLSLAYSGVHPDALNLLTGLLNEDIYPYIPSHGGVGASGDLVQLAHLALVMLGEGRIFDNGEWKPAADRFDELGLKPMEIHIREGLALMNGTSVMSGIGIVNVILSQRLIEWSMLATLMLNEIVETYNDHYSPQLVNRKKHSGQQEIGRLMQELLKDSRLTQQREDDLFHNSDQGEFSIKKKVQEYYSLRCIPQIMGPILDTLRNTEKVLMDEVNSVSDNPIIDRKNNNVYHGGNFHGDYISLEMDKLRIATTKLSMLAERQLNFLLNPKINGILPPFVNLGTLGLNFGMQGAQFTATSTTAESQTLAGPMYTHSIPNNNDNQDIVSMGTNSALLTRKVIDNTFQVLAIELITLIQAIDAKGFRPDMSKATSEAYDALRTIVPRFEKDYPLENSIRAMEEFIKIDKPEIMNWD